MKLRPPFFALLPLFVVAFLIPGHPPVPQVTGLTSCGVISTTGSYQLSNNVTATQSCFNVQANNVTIDLHGQTITYGTSPGSTSAPIAASPTGLVSNGTTLTVTLTSALTLVPGNVVEFSGYTSPQTGSPGQPTTCPVATVISSTQFTATACGLADQGAGTGGGGTVTFYIQTQGIYVIACYDPDFNSGNEGSQPCTSGPSGANLTVYDSVGGGGIIASTNTGPFSPAIRVGQGPSGAVTIYNIGNITTSGIETDGFNIQYQGGGVTVHNVTFNNNATVVFSRLDIGADALNIRNATSCTVADQLYDNTIIGGPQGGIIDNCPGTQIYGNTIYLKTTYTNGRAVWLAGPNQNSYNNTVKCGGPTGYTSYYCRGGGADFLNGGASGDTFGPGDTFYAQDDDVNIEYGGCEIGGGDAVELRSSTGNGQTVTGENLTVFDNLCQGSVIRMTDPATNLNTSTGNTLNAVRVGSPTTSQYAACFAFDDGTNFTSSGDTCNADTTAVYMDTFGGCALLLKNDTFNKGSNPDSNWTFMQIVPTQTDTCLGSGANPGPGPAGWCGTTIEVRDATFGAGVDPNTNNLTLYGGTCDASGNYHQQAQYFISWTYTLTVLYSGRPAVGINVSIVDADSNTEFSGTTNGAGQIIAPLYQWRRYNTTSVANNLDTKIPQAVTISYTNCTTINYNLSITATTSGTENLSCTSPPPTAGGSILGGGAALGGGSVIHPLGKPSNIEILYPELRDLW